MTRIPKKARPAELWADKFVKASPAAQKQMQKQLLGMPIAQQAEKSYQAGVRDGIDLMKQEVRTLPPSFHRKYLLAMAHKLSKTHSLTSR